jgi:hypothetical protein
MAIIERSQRILLIAPGTDVGDYISMAKTEDCCAIIRGIPSEVQERAIAEAWTFPRVYVETWNEEVPDTVTP